MEKIILKNQKELQNSLPAPQLGSKYSKLAQKFANTPNSPSNSNLSKKNLSFSQYSSFNQFNQQTNKLTQKSQNTLEQTQLQYFKQVNNQIKLENLNLKHDLKICQQKLKKITQEKLINQQKLLTYHKTVAKSQKKISSLMQFAQQLIVMVKDRYFDQQKASSLNFNSLKDAKSVKSFIDPLEARKIEMQKEMKRIKELTDASRRVSTIKKKTIQTMMQQHKAQVQNLTKHQKKAKKSTFYQLSNNKSINQVNDDAKVNQQVSNWDESVQIEENSQVELLNSLRSFQRDVKEIKVLKKLMEGIVRTFNQETQTDSGLLKINNDEEIKDESQIMNFVLQQIGTFFNSLVEQHSQHINPTLCMDSLVINEKIKPNYTSQRLYKSIKEIFDHQIHLLESQKMHFLQCKNKRLLKFIYECSGCERYEQMFAEIFRILREGFKEIKWKILPELKNKSQDQLEIIL